MQEAEEVAGKLVEAREATSILLELTDEALDEVTFFIKLSIIFSRLVAVFLRRNHRLGPHLSDGEKHVLGIVGFIAHDELGFATLQ